MKAQRRRYHSASLEQARDIYFESSGEQGTARSRRDREHEKDQSLSIYTDGSGTDGEIGATAAYLFTKQTRTVHMGPDTLTRTADVVVKCCNH